MSGASQETLAHLTAYGNAIGLAFQIADDILDIEGGAELGKDIGSDIAKGKSTYPSLMGIENAKKEAQKALENALTALAKFGDKSIALKEIAQFIVSRKK